MFLLLLDDKVGLCYFCIFRCVLVHFMDLVVYFVVDSLCLFLVISQVLPSCFHVFSVFAFHF